MSDLVDNPLFYQVIGQQIALNRENGELEHDAASLHKRIKRLNGEVDKANNYIDSLRGEVNHLSSSENGLYASITGVRGVTRELLKELSRSDPNNPLLEKKVRDKIFMEGFNAVEPVSRVLSPTQRKNLVPKWTESAFGAEGAGLGGPEKSKITPNNAVRKAAGVPEDHIPDRERFIALIGRLASELKTHDPHASILTEKAMADVIAQAI